MDSNTQTLLIVFVALTGLAVLLQALVLFGIFIALRKTSKSVLIVTEDMKATVIPMIHSTRELLERISPQIITISAGISDLTEAMQNQSKGVRISVAEIMERVSRQTRRLDEMLTTGLNTVEKASTVLETTVAMPVRQANGIVAAIKAAINSYRADIPQRKPITYPDPDRDLVI